MYQKVWKVSFKKTGKIYAIKEMSKAKIIDKKSVDNILGEKNLLSQLHHPFIVNMIYSFQDQDYLYLVMDLLPGGNLRYHISLKRHFNEKQNKFLIGCILVGLEYIHGQNILHRDIKPENLVFDDNGYLRITDFGIAKKYTINNKKDTSGTVGYLAPEVLCNQNHNFSIDYYAVGIITYELAYGCRPYIGKTKHDVKQLILTKQAHIDFEDLPDEYDKDAADFINKLIQRKPKNRLGKDSIKEVINHPWFKGFDWENLKSKKLSAFYIPKNEDNFDKKYCLNNKIETDTIERYRQIIMEPNYSKIFKNFDCNKVPDELKIYNKSNKNKNGDTLINNNSSNNLTTSISRNNKNINLNDNVKKSNNYKLLLSKQKNKSMENIFEKNSNNIKEEIKSLNKQLSFANIINNKKILENKKIFNNINLKKGNEISKEYKLLFNKKNENKIINKFSLRKDKNKKKNLIRLKDNNFFINKNQNIIQNFSTINKEKSSLIDTANFISQRNDKNYLFENFCDISQINKNKKEENDIYERQSLIDKNQNINNLYYKNASLMNKSNSSANIFFNDIFPNFKANYIKKVVNNNLHKDPTIINKNITNTINSGNSPASLVKKNSNLSQNYFKNSRKHFIKKEIFNGTFYPNKFSQNKFFDINSNKIYKKRKVSASIANKSNNNFNNNRRLTSSYSNHNLKRKLNNNDNLSGLMSNNNFIINSKEANNIISNIDKKLPSININISLDKKKVTMFRNNLHILNNKKYLSENGFFSQRIKNKDNIKLKNSINKNNINNK